MRTLWMLLAGLLLIGAPAAHAAQAGGMVVGVNVVNPLRASIADQNALLAQLKAAGVHVIRCAISQDAKGIDFAKRAAAQGIQLQLGVGPQYTPGPRATLSADDLPRHVGRPAVSPKFRCPLCTRLRCPLFR